MYKLFVYLKEFKIGNVVGTDLYFICKKPRYTCCTALQEHTLQLRNSLLTNCVIAIKKST